MACKIVYNQEGKTEVFNEDGTQSMLYQRALTLHDNNQDKALSTWAVSQTDSFKELYPESKPTLEQVLTYSNLSLSEDAVMNVEEFVQTKELLDTLGESSLSSLYEKLVDIFRPNGYLDYSSQRAVESGLYTLSEIDNIDLEKVEDFITKIESQLRYSDIAVETTGTEYEFINSEELTPIGTYKKVKTEDLIDDLLTLSDKVNDNVEFMTAVESLPYQGLVDRILEDETFAKELKDRLSQVTDVPTVVLEEGAVKIGYNPKFDEVRNFILRGYNTVALKARTNVLSSFTDFAWTQEQEIKAVIRKNVSLFRDANVDLIGLEEFWQDRDTVLSLFDSAIEMLDNPTDSNIRSFVELREQVLPAQTKTTKVVLPEVYRGLSIARVFSRLSDSELFNDYGLIKIADNYYHKVDLQDSKDDLYELVYQKYVNGEIEIPTEYVTEKDFKNPSNKVEVLYDLEAFVSSRDTGIKVQDNELLSLFQVAFNHQPIPKVNQSKAMAMVNSAIETVGDIRENFLPEFYNYYLQEKSKDSEVYKSTLSKLSFNEKGITMDKPISTTAQIRPDLRVKFEDYIKLRKDADMDYLVQTDMGDHATEDSYYLNNPDRIPVLTNAESFLKGKYLLVAGATNNFTKVGERVFRKVLETPSTTLYQEIIIQEDNLFYDNSLNFEFDADAAKEFMKDHKLITPQRTSESNKQVLKEAKFNPTTKRQVEDKVELKEDSITEDEGNYLEKLNISTNFTENLKDNESNTRRGNRARWNPSRGNQTLEGAPINTKRRNVTGADPELTFWAEEYARRNGIDYRRQSVYVEVDINRAERLAEEYGKMSHSPQDPKVKEAYQNLINQTLAQYNILVEAGYQFYFFDESNDPYNGNPMSAMEELRNEKRMGSFATEAGFGSGATELNVEDNPMLTDTGLEWGFGSVDGKKKRVLANDLFRAVHDAFGHGLEGASFRARGEENAWQAHARLFTGSA